MLSTFRKSLDSWIVRILFFALALAFGVWGIGDVLRQGVLGPSDAATVGDQHITQDQLAQLYRNQMQQLTRMLGDKQPTQEMRDGVARQALEQLVTQAALTDAAQKLGLAVSDSALRDAVMQIPAFRNQSGQFDRNQMQVVLQNNNLTEDRFIQLMRNDLLTGQLIQTIQAGITPSPTLVTQAYQAQAEQRVATTVSLPFAAAPPPTTPDDATLRRWYQNHPEQFSTQAYRRIRAIVLAPETVARSLDVPLTDEQAYYEQHKADYVQPEKRSLQIITAGDPKIADALATQWKAGADWATIQAAATKAGAAPTTFDSVTKDQLADPALGQAAFAAAQGVVTGPVTTGLGSTAVLRIDAITQGNNQSFDQVRDQIRQTLAQQKASDLVYERANKVEDALAGGATLQEMPADLGLAGVEGTLNTEGNTPDGKPAPIPGGPQLRAALIQAAFQANQGDAPHLTEAPDHSYFALTVEQILPSEPEPFDKVRDKVLADWTRDQLRREQNILATSLMTQARAGKSLVDAAGAAGRKADRTPPISRNGAPPPGVPAALIGPLFTLKKGDATMVETPDGFVVAQLVDTIDPDPTKDPAGVAQLTDQLTKSLANDYALIYAAALRARGNARINPKVIADVSQS
jgi:peptidyl-prolyl cis-trans isomerase D